MKNILFLMADEFRHDIAGFAGNPVARTPYLDRLAENAMRFARAYTPSPVCVPARQCMATGRYPERAGCTQFLSDIPPGSPTFARWFSDHGYYTVACGKLHHRGPDQMQGWLHRIGSETAVRWPEAYSERNQIGRRKWQGADDLRKAGPGVSPLGIQDDYAVQGACDFIRIHFGGMYDLPRETPLLMMVSLQQPHFPLLADRDLYDYYHDRVPVFTDQPRPDLQALNVGRIGEDDGIGQEDIRRATAAYYAMVEKTDQRLGRVIRALEDAGQDLEEWIVVFASDHGDMLGQHGLWEKRKFYDGSARIPLFVRAPGLEAGVNSAPANLVDLFPTLCGLAGLPRPEGVDGHDLLTDPPTVTFSQYQADKFMACDGRWKYMAFPEGEEALFDLSSDPAESINLRHSTEHATRLEEMRRKLKEFRAIQEIDRLC